MIRIDAIWLATEPMDMRAGTETALARVIAVFGAAQPHCAYLFANRRATRIKVLVHDGFGVWRLAGGSPTDSRKISLAQQSTWHPNGVQPRTASGASGFLGRDLDLPEQSVCFRGHG